MSSYMPAETTATSTVPKSIGIIISTTRPNRIGPQVADWVKTVLECAKPSLAKNIKLSMIDIRTFNLPLFDEPFNPATVRDFTLFKGAHSRMWNEEIARHDGYIIVLGEYHGGMPGSFKNAIDYLFHAWTGKPAMVVSYGIFGGKAASDNLCAILSGAMKMDIIGVRTQLPFPKRDVAANNTSPSLFAAMQGSLTEEARVSWEAQAQDIVTGAREMVRKLYN